MAQVDPGTGERRDRSFRQPDDPARLPPRWLINQILDLGDFNDFQSQLESIHDFVHVWIGGITAEIPWAAFDPLFWAHHSMIDRLWRLWQLRHPRGGPPTELLGAPLPPMRMTVADTLSVTALGYEYASAARFPRS